LLCISSALAQPAAGAAGAASPARISANASSTTDISGTSDVYPEFKDALPQSRLIGKARLAVWGFQVYDARLWASPGFNADRYQSEPLALELTYLRDFNATDIAARSLKEMRRTLPIANEQAALWTTEMLRVIPDVKKGDRLFGLYRPGVGVSFWHNGKISGDIRDAEFAKLFFGIWLSPKTSEPKLRELLLSSASE